MAASFNWKYRMGNYVLCFSNLFLEKNFRIKCYWPTQDGSTLAENLSAMRVHLQTNHASTTFMLLSRRKNVADSWLKTIKAKYDQCKNILESGFKKHISRSHIRPRGVLHSVTNQITTSEIFSWFKMQM